VTPYLAPILVLIAIPLIFLGVFAGLQRLSGWRRMAARFPAAPMDVKPKLCCIGVRWAWLGYNNCTRVGSDDDHVHLRSLLPFHPPVSIPWSEVERLEATAFSRAHVRADGFDLWLPRSLVANEVVLREAIERDESNDGGAPVDSPA